MKKALTFSCIFVLSSLPFLHGCENPGNTPAPSTRTPISATKDTLINRQGPNSTGITQPILNGLVKPINSYDITKSPGQQVSDSPGGLFYISYKGGMTATNSRFRVKYTKAEKSEILAEGYTGDTGQALVSDTVFTPERIANLKSNQAKLEIFVIVADKEYPAEIKNIDYKLEKSVTVRAEADAPRPLSVQAPQKLNIDCSTPSDISASVAMSDGTKSSDVTWESSDEKTAAVKDGKISGLKQGTTTLTASATTGLDISTDIAVTVSCNK
jgi:hypothetical protein